MKPVRKYKCIFTYRNGGIGKFDLFAPCAKTALMTACFGWMQQVSTDQVKWGKKPDLRYREVPAGPNVRLFSSRVVPHTVAAPVPAANCHSLRKSNGLRRGRHMPTLTGSVR